MRITGGTYKGRTIVCPPGVIRPAMDRMRESMFAILGDLSGLSFLDLYAGSGVVGVEAASRGASPVVFVEKDFGKKAVLERNVSFVREDTLLELMPAERYVRRCKLRFDLIFLDPPYGQKGTSEVLQVIVDRRLLHPAGRLLLHVPREAPSARARPLVVVLAGVGMSLLLARAGGNVNALKAALNEAVTRLPKVEGQGGEVSISRDLNNLLNLTEIDLADPGVVSKQLAECAYTFRAHNEQPNVPMHRFELFSMTLGTGENQKEYSFRAEEGIPEKTVTYEDPQAKYTVTLLAVPSHLSSPLSLAEAALTLSASAVVTHGGPS